MKQQPIHAPPPLPNLHNLIPQQHQPPSSSPGVTESKWRDNIVYHNPIGNTNEAAAQALNGPPAPGAGEVKKEAMDVRFLHGIASGDPLSDSVILWTKITPAPGSDDTPIAVMYQVFSSPIVAEPIPSESSKQVPVQAGAVVTGSEVDYTVKVDVKGLRPSTRYYYRFYVNSPSSMRIYSPSGSTLTLPDKDADIDSLRLAIVSCSNAAMGFFNSYSNVAARQEVDVVVHLGDYIYEYADGEFGYGEPIGRVPEPNVNLRTLTDYRTRHAQYKTDLDLQAAHAAHPWIVIWDDHEFMDNIDGRNEHDERVRAGMRAYFEYLPIRETTLDGQGFIYRTFHFGRLVDLIMLDTRMEGRDETDIRDWELMSHPNRTMLGDTQEKWFLDQLSTSQSRQAHWRFVGNQVVFSPIRAFGHAIGVDSWDGYPAARARIMDYIKHSKIDNIAFLTGDIHASFIYDIPSDPYFPTHDHPLAVEFVGPSISSPTPLESLSIPFLNPPAEHLVRFFSPHNHYVNLREHGYMLVHLTKAEMRVEYWYTESVRRRTQKERLGAVGVVRSGDARVGEVEVGKMGMGSSLRRGLEGGMRKAWFEWPW
ncbi:hypothetical protein HK097_006310 [Rhizophlyctis rosea]|uniref:Alkaline phosphatase n=1 Tax=Rhizophlyctis rosea TaxID=64517 RepID=A0AAD5SDD9_9FUNG|nr:hypothetical protein HK097_006310 [Rhizophlyctis rosea]